MGTVSQLHERSRPPAHRIESEDEALDIARALARDFARQASDRDINRVLPYQEIDALSQSGLLGITIPADHAGLDISNSVLAEINAILAESDPSIAQVPQIHFTIIEALRTNGSDEQKAFFFARALDGDRFASAHAQGGGAAAPDGPRLTLDGSGFRASGRASRSSGVLFADWIAISALDPEGRPTLSFLSRSSEGVQVIDDWDGFGQRTTGNGTTILHNAPVSADAVMRYRRAFDGPTTVSAVGQIIHAAIDLGIGRATFAETLNFVRNHAPLQRDSRLERASDDPLTIARIGQIAIALEAASAIIERAGQKIDIAQIEPVEQNVIEAALAVAAANALTTQMAVEASNTLFELAGTASTSIGLNLDRHWRNARTHTLQSVAAWKQHAVGNYHLNGASPPGSDGL